MPRCRKIATGRLLVAAINRQAKRLIGLYGIEPKVLQGVCLQLCHQPDPSPFLLVLNQPASILTGDGPHRELQRIATVAAQRPQHVTGEALGMNPQQWRISLHLTQSQHDRSLHPAHLVGSLVEAAQHTPFSFPEVAANYPSDALIFSFSA
jgi:hypothetical protein